MPFLKSPNSPWLYDNTTGDLVGFRDPDGSDQYFARVPHIGSFVDVSDQTASLNTATAMECDTTEISDGISMVDNSKITVTRTGIYNIAFSAQFENGSNDEREVSIWLRKQGNNVANSNTTITIPKKHAGGNAFKVAAWNFFVELEAGQNAQIYWSVNGADVQISHADAQTSPVRPVTPSVIITVNEVGGQ